jgi:hypothetical protein
MKTRVELSSPRRAKSDGTGARLAMTVAALFASACDKTPSGSVTESMPAKAPAAVEQAPSAEPGAIVQCLGIHECKGKSACHIAGGHTCAGQNSCKGKGWISVPRSECDAKGGKVLDG